VPNNEYKDLQGTSMAAPVVAGVAAAVWSYYPELTVLELKSVLLKSAQAIAGPQIIPFNEDLPDRKMKKDKEGNPVDGMRTMAKVSGTGGVVNLFYAFQLADQMVAKKK
jgi:subtilisin family serine protease